MKAAKEKLTHIQADVRDSLWGIGVELFDSYLEKESTLDFMQREVMSLKDEIYEVIDKLDRRGYNIKAIEDGISIYDRATKLIKRIQL